MFLKKIKKKEICYNLTVLVIRNKKIDCVNEHS